MTVKTPPNRFPDLWQDLATRTSIEPGTWGDKRARTKHQHRGVFAEWDDDDEGEVRLTIDIPETFDS